MRRFIQPDIILYFFLLLLGVGGFFVAVVWPQTEGFYAFSVLASLGGIGVTSYIFYGKRFKQHLACPTGSDCNAVVNSKYAKFFGIPLEYLGFCYYLIITVGYLLLIFLPALRETALLPGVLFLTAGAFLFSLYLLFVQAFLLRQWCIWCLLSAGLSIAIFIVSLASISFAQNFLYSIRDTLLLMREIVLAFGMATVTGMLLLFFKFLKNDLDIDDGEARTLAGFSEVVWFLLALTVAVTYTIYVASPEYFLASARLLVGLIVLSVIFVTGVIFNILFAPVVSSLPFFEHKLQPAHKATFLSKLRRYTLLTGAVNLISWYFAFAIPYMAIGTFSTLFGIYVALVISAVLASIMFNWLVR